jgi:hypothetical protein
MALSAMRTSLRVVNNVPMLKRRMIDAENEFRGADRHAAPAAHGQQYGQQVTSA